MVGAQVDTATVRAAHIRDYDDCYAIHWTDAAKRLRKRIRTGYGHRRKPGAAMKTLGQFLIERRKALGLSQKEMAALIKNRDGKTLSATYLNYLEHDRVSNSCQHIIQTKHLQQAQDLHELTLAGPAQARFEHVTDS